MLNNLPALTEYERFPEPKGGDPGDITLGLGGRRFGCILSCGEPLTEWIGWLAFLRHGSKEVSAYCLRPRVAKDEACTHKEKPDDPAPLSPAPVNSVFQEGRMDLLLLPAGYGRSMRRYHDTLVIVWNDDPDWNNVLRPRTSRHDEKSREDVYVRIPVF
jgi:hypothetical protein